MTTGVGLLGCGAIGQELARAIQAGEAGGAYLAALFDQVEGLAASVAGDLGGGVLGTDSMGDFLAAPGLDLVVECASPHAVRAHAEAVLSAGKDLLMMSSGALADPDLAERLSDLAQREQRRLIVPSGALGGIDAIRAARGRLDRVTLTTTKPPRGLAGAPGFAECRDGSPMAAIEISEPTVVFDGPAIEAVKLFPANVNVAATLSLAGLGAQETRVKVVADPARSTVNVHEVEATPTSRSRPGHPPLQDGAAPPRAQPQDQLPGHRLRRRSTPRRLHPRHQDRHLAHGARARLCSPVVPAKPSRSAPPSPLTYKGDP